MKSPVDVIFSKEMLEIFQHIAQALEFRMSFLDLSFQEVAPLNLQSPCAFCRIVQNDLGLMQSCLNNDEKYCSQARETNSVVHYHCHAGLREAAFPLFIGDECIGFFLVGQFRTAEELPHSLLFKASPRERTILKEEYNKLPAYDGKKLESVLEIIRITTAYIMEHRLLSVRQKVLADKLLDYINLNIHDSVRMEDAVRLFKKSASTINQILRVKTGKSFKQLFLTVKIDEAARQMIEQPERSIGEISLEFGISDPLYFSRIFKKYKGCSPREFRRKKQTAVE